MRMRKPAYSLLSHQLEQTRKIKDEMSFGVVALLILENLLEVSRFTSPSDDEIAPRQRYNLVRSNRMRSR